MNRFLADWRLHWFLLLLPVALLLPAVPIDETRYLAVAWEMRFSHDFLALHLNGAPYADKGPLLFWLINLSWLPFGLHVWTVRLGMLIASLGSLILFERLALRLTPPDVPDRTALATRAALLLCGIVYFALFFSAIMFDVVLTTFVLVALHGVVDLDERRWGRGVALLALGLGLGMLTKGPVVLLDAGLVALFGPWWSATAREHPGRWYGCLLVGVLGSIAIALIWAVAVYGLDGLWSKIILRQTVGRVASSFAHQRPLWWYFYVLPLMILPWTLALRAPWRTWRDHLAREKAVRFGLAWFVPAFAVFCLVSGKQPHYLLPLLPGLALYLAHVLRDGAVRGRAFGVLLIVGGLILYAAPMPTLRAALLPWLDRLISDGTLGSNAAPVVAGLWPLWGALLVLLGVFMVAHRTAHTRLRAVALSSVAAASVCLLAIAQGTGPTIDVSATAARIRAAQESGKPIVYLGWPHGLFEFPGRLTKPLEKVDFADLYTWCAAHPDGEIVTFYTKYPIAVKPMIEIPYRLGHILIWRARDLCAGPRTTAPTKPDEDETPED